MPRHRAFVLVAAALAGAAGLSNGDAVAKVLGRPSCPVPRANDRQLASTAYVWGYPLIRSAQLRQNMTLPEDPFRQRPSSVPGAPINRLGHARDLATPALRQGVAPNNDTLYSLAWLDLDAGPFVLTAPDFGDRYYTLQLGHADTTTDLALGQRSHGGQLPPLFIQGAQERHRVPSGMVEVRSKQRYLMIAARTLVKDRADLAAAHRLQDGMRLRRWSDFRSGRHVAAPVTPQRLIERRDPPAGDAPAFLAMLGVVLKDWHPAPEERRLVRSFAQLGLTPEHGFDPGCLTGERRAAVEQGLQDGRASIERRTLELGANLNGWSINYLGSKFGSDYMLRAAVAMDQIYVLPADEALYMTAKRDVHGRPLDGRKSYILTFSKDNLPPVKFFWSVTMYYAKGLLVPNEIERYSVGDRTPGIVRNPDGSIEILMQSRRPEPGSRENWLPTPAEPFMAMLRLYGPAAAVRDRSWRPPPITEVPRR